MIQLAHSYRVQRLDFIPGYQSGRKVWLDVQKIGATWAKAPHRVQVKQEADAATSAMRRRIEEYLHNKILRDSISVTVHAYESKPWWRKWWCRIVE